MACGFTRGAGTGTGAFAAPGPGSLVCGLWLEKSGTAVRCFFAMIAPVLTVRVRGCEGIASVRYDSADAAGAASASLICP